MLWILWQGSILVCSVYKQYKKQKKDLNMLNLEDIYTKCEVFIMIQSKKGADLSMNVIIIAAIALLVLVILAVLLFRSGGQVTEGTSCDNLAGENSRCDTTRPDGWIANPALDSSCPSGQHCYVKLGSTS